MHRQDDVRIERQQHATEIAHRLKAHVADVLAQFPVDMAYLYGSVAQGRPLPASDVDVALVLTESLPPYERLAIELKIQAALEDGCGLSNVDVRAINHAPLTVQGRIIQEGQLVFERDRGRRVAFEALTRRKYFGYLPTANRMRKAFLDHIRRKGLSGGRSRHRHIHPE